MQELKCQSFKVIPRSGEKESAKTEDIDSRCIKTTETVWREKETHLGIVQSEFIQSFKTCKFHLSNKWSTSFRNSYPQLHWAIADLETAGANVYFRRWTDVLNACQILDTLHSALLKEGYVLSHQVLYLWLIPRSLDSNEGKLHVRTVPVKIRKTQNNPRNRHEDTNFSFTTKQYMKDMASLFGTENVFVLSVDDKAEVLIGVTTITKQSSLVMHVDYEISLPDHELLRLQNISWHRLGMLLVRFAQLLQKLFRKFPIQVQHTLLFAMVCMTQVPPIPMDVILVIYWNWSNFRVLLRLVMKLSPLLWYFQMVGLMKTHISQKLLTYQLNNLRNINLMQFLNLPMLQVRQPTIKWKEEWHHWARFWQD